MTPAIIRANAQSDACSNPGIVMGFGAGDGDGTGLGTPMGDGDAAGVGVGVGEKAGVGVGVGDGDGETVAGQQTSSGKHMVPGAVVFFSIQTAFSPGGRSARDRKTTAHSVSHS